MQQPGRFLLAIDQGTTSTRAMLFTTDGKPAAIAQQEITLYYPEPSWVEQDAEEIWQKTLSVCREVLQKANIDAKAVIAVGITNQRETTVVWERATGKPIYHAIVWQDRRTAASCQALKAKGLESDIRQKTGLLLDPYFSATKMAWILDHVPGARARADKGELLTGTIDSFLLWHLTGGKTHATDVTNASRTLLFDLRTRTWDANLLKTFNVPLQILPAICDSAAEFGVTDEKLFGTPIPIRGVMGDQQAAAFGQACFEPGTMKSTYGTGCFLLVNTGNEILQSSNQLLSTVAYGLSGHLSYALEGSIFVAGAVVQWLRDALQCVASSDETEVLAKQAADNAGVYFVPAFTGLGAPYWDPDARGAILGLTRGTGRAHIVRAALEAVAYQTKDLVMAMQADGVPALASLKVDGGMTHNTFVMQFLADVLGVVVRPAAVAETTALGAAYLAGLQSGVYNSLDDIKANWQGRVDFLPTTNRMLVDKWYQGWQQAVGRVTN